MVTAALLVRLEAKPGRQADVESFLRGGLPIVEDELSQPPTLEKVDVLAVKLPS